MSDNLLLVDKVHGGYGRISILDSDKDIVKKELLINYIDNPQAIKRLKREIEALLQFDSNRIVKLIDYDLDKYSWYTMPRYKYDLEKFYDEIEIEEKTVLKIANNILEALSVIESKNFVHRDLKPKNILLNSIDDLVVCDFGLVKWQRNTVLTKTVQGIGTEYYADPHQLNDKNAKSVDIRADIFSFGRILTWLFTKEETVDINHELIPAKYRSLIRKCVEYDLNQRYKSIDELKSALEHRMSETDIISRDKMLEQITKNSDSYINFITISDSELNKYVEEDLYKLIINGKLHTWLIEDFDSFDKVYKLWEKKRDSYYKMKKYYPANNADPIGLKFKKYILDKTIPFNVRVSLFKKLIYHFGNRYNVMDNLFEILTEGNSDEEFITYLLDNLSEEDFDKLKYFYKNVGKNHNNISSYFLKRIIV